MSVPSEYWAAYEAVVGTLSDYVELVCGLAWGWPEQRFV
jgi:hypothetical protein